jgi:hypothetical protein
MIDLVYYNDFIRCFRSGVVERLNQRYKPAKWTIVENTAHNDGYNTININGKPIYRHRLLAYCFLGLDDIVGEKNNDNCIDHKSGNKIDNSVENLRITTNQGNHHNRTTAKGYYWHKLAKKWKAQIGLNGKNIHLGLYDTEEEAHQAYLDGKEKYHISI